MCEVRTAADLVLRQVPLKHTKDIEKLNPQVTKRKATDKLKERPSKIAH